ncbi:hypothetical protein HY994_03085 [Candidatus Micrarchaeota archaeon]|nr:hypothetical protein [Candidatus Micrarchaeota archaeon]
MGESDRRTSLFQSIGDAIAPIQEKLAEWDEAIREKTDDRLTLPMVAGIIAIFLILLLAVFFISLTSNVFSFSITDANGNPLDGAIVRLFDDNGNLVATARSVNGTVHFDGIPNRKYAYTVSMDGYETAKGTYDPANLASGKIKLIPSKSNPGLNGSNGRSPGSNSSFSDKPPDLPPSTVILPIGNNGGGGIVPTPTDTPGFSADAKLIVTVRDNSSDQPVFNAVVTLYDGTTQAYLVQGQTNAQGSLVANVRQGGSILVKAQAQGFAPAEPKYVGIKSAESSVELRLSSAISGQASATNISVVDGNGSAVSTALVQVFSSPPSIEQYTAIDGRLSVLLQKGVAYTARASKPGYQDASKSLFGGDAIQLVLLDNSANILPANITVSLVETNGIASPAGMVGLFKKINTTFVPLASMTANDQGLAFFYGLQANWTVQINATSSRGIPSVSKDLNLTAGMNNVQLVFPAGNGNGSNANTSNNTGGTNATNSSNSTNGSNGQNSSCSQRFTICTQVLQGPIVASANGFNYSLVAVNGVQLAAFEVRKNGSIFCPPYTPDCQYALGSLSAANMDLANRTRVNLTLSSIDPKKLCVEGYLGLLVAGSCQQPAQTCPTKFDPVCASNGVTYANACEASLAHAGTTISGACSTACTNQVDPVCAGNGIQYTNACQAIADHQEYRAGVCPIPNSGRFIDVPAGWSAIAPMGGGSFLATDCTTLNRYVFQSYVPASMSYSPVKPSVSATTSMQYGTGYFVYSEKACRIYWQDVVAPTPYSRKLSVGWDLVGAPSNAIKVRDVLGDCTGVTFRSLFGSMAENDRGTLLGLDDILTPGRGYWVGYDGSVGSSCTLSDVKPLIPSDIVSAQYLLYPFSGTTVGVTCPHAPQSESESILCQAAWDEKCGLLGYVGGVSNDWDGTGMAGFCFRKGASYGNENFEPTGTSVTQPMPQDVVTRKRFGFPYSGSHLTCPRAPQSFGERSLCIAAFDEKCGVLGYLGGSAIDWDGTGQEGFCYRAGATYSNENLPVSRPTSWPKGSDILTRTRMAFPLPMLSIPSVVCNGPQNYQDYYYCQAAYDEKCVSQGFTGGTPIDWDGSGIEGFCFANLGSPPAVSAPATCAQAGGACVNPGPGFFGLSGSVCSNGGQPINNVGPFACPAGSVSICCSVPDNPTTQTTIQSTPSTPTPTPTSAPTVAPLPIVDTRTVTLCKKSIVGTCAASGTACASTCPAGYSPSAGSCAAGGTDPSGYGLLACIGSAQCLSEESYPTLGSCNPGDVAVSSGPAASTSIFACQRTAVGICASALGASACTNSCPSGFVASAGSCGGSADSGGYGLICSGSAQCLSALNYFSLSGCGNDIQISKVPATQYNVCRRKAIGTCGAESNLRACSNVCPSGFAPGAGSCQSTGSDSSGYGLVLGCSGNAECLSTNSYLASGACNAGDVQVSASSIGTYYAQCKRRASVECGSANAMYGSCSSGNCPSGFSSSEKCDAVRVYGQFLKNYEYYCQVPSTGGRILQCLSDATYVRAGDCDPGDLQVGTALGN